MTDLLPSPKRRMRAVYSVPEDPPVRSERVMYQLEDTGHPVLRYAAHRAPCREGDERILLCVDAFSRLSGAHLGQAEVLAEPAGPADYAARAREYQATPFRDVIEELSLALIERFSARELAASEGSQPQRDDAD